MIWNHNFGSIRSCGRQLTDIAGKIEFLLYADVYVYDDYSTGSTDGLSQGNLNYDHEQCRRIGGTYKSKKEETVSTEGAPHRASKKHLDLP